jgi:putative flippase GtrA
MQLNIGLKTLVVICLLGLILLWGVLLNANISWLKGYWSLICLFYLTCNIILFAIGEKYSRFKVAARYLIIGVLNTLVDLGVLSFFLYFNPTKTTDWFYVFFKALSFILALGNSYYFNGHFSFSDSKQTGSFLSRISKFLTVSLLAFVINISLSTLVNHFNIWSLSPRFWGVLAAFIASLFGLMINFVGYRFWVFKKE